MANCLLEVINGQYSSTLNHHMTKKTPGKVFFAALYWSLQVVFTAPLSTSYPNVWQAYKHIFTSPSSVDKEPKATRSGNARIHGMTRATPASIAYVATQVSNLSSIHIFRMTELATIGSIRLSFVSRFFAYGYHYRFGDFLSKSPRASR